MPVKSLQQKYNSDVDVCEGTSRLNWLNFDTCNLDGIEVERVVPHRFVIDEFVNVNVPLCLFGCVCGFCGFGLVEQVQRSVF